MSTPYTVSAEETARGAGAVDGVIASLPLSLAESPEGGQIASIDGGKTGWRERAQAALDGGALASIVVTPTANGATAPEDSPRILLDWAFASNPAVERAADAARPLVEQTVLLESRMVLPSGTEPMQCLLDQVTTIARIIGEGTFAPGSLRQLFADQNGYQFAGSLPGGAPVKVSAVVSTSASPHLGIRLLTKNGSLAVYIPAPHTAAPAEIRLVTSDGELLLPTEYESAHRATWRRAVRMLREGEHSQDLAELVQTAAALQLLP
jgi:hypothetical protein